MGASELDGDSAEMAEASILYVGIHFPSGQRVHSSEFHARLHFTARSSAELAGRANRATDERRIISVRVGKEYYYCSLMRCGSDSLSILYVVHAGFIILIRRAHHLDTSLKSPRAGRCTDDE